jgi:hypothetical protein
LGWALATGKPTTPAVMKAQNIVAGSNFVESMSLLLAVANGFKDAA